MNEFEDISRLFASASPPAPDQAFIAAVRARIERERRKTRLIAAAGGFAFAAVLALALLLIPIHFIDPFHVVQEFLTSFTGIAVCAMCAIALTAWLRTEDAW